MDFGNVLTAMVTPFDNNGEIDLVQTSVLIEHLIANGTDGLIITGTTGESPTLTKEEKLLLYKHVVKTVNKRIPVIAGTGNYNTATSMQLTMEAEACGVDGIMIVTPYYNRPNQQGLYEHFSRIAAVTKLPIMMYNIPGRSVVNMTAETVIRLSKIKNITSIKEASGDLAQIASIIEKTDDEFVLYSGDDSMTLPILSIGGTGVVSVASHIIGNEMNELIHSFKNGQIKRSALLHRTNLPIMTGIFMAPSPAPIKAALKMIGLDVGTVRLPLVDLTAEEKNKLEQLISI